MKRVGRVCLALLCLLSTVCFSSCRLLLAAGILTYDEKREEKRQASRMEAVVEDVTMTVEEQGEHRFSVDVAFWLQNNGANDCDDWELAVYYYDEEGYLIYAYTICDNSYEYDKNIQSFREIKSGERKELRVNDQILHYRPATVKIGDVGLFYLK